MSGNVLEVSGLQVDFRLYGQGVLRVVDGVSFRVPHGKTVALVGESGSGKSVISQSVMRILPTVARISGGEIRFRTDPRDVQGVDITALAPDSAEMRKIRGGRISMIFQEPMTSLSPLHTVGDQVGEAVAAAPGRDPRRGTCPRGGNAGTGRISQTRQGARQLSVRIVGGVAPARDDRDGTGVPPVAAGSRTSPRPHST